MNTDILSSHTSKRFNDELDHLRNQVMRMGGLVEGQLEEAIRAVTEGDSALGLKVAKNDEIVNDCELEIDEECARLLATWSPAAGDLRFIFAVIKTITDLERIGDEAEKIGFLASRLAEMEQPVNRYRELKTLGNHVLDMLGQTLHAFSRLDTDASIKIAESDKEVDDEYESITRECVTFMMEDPRTIKRVMNVMWAARALERIGDHAKNICEYIIYVAEGKDIRHIEITDVKEEISRESS